MLKRTIFLLLILPFVLLACSAPEDEAAVVSDEVVETESEVVVEDEAMEDAADSDAEMADSSDAGEATIYTVDTAASTLTWTGSKPIGDSHTGTIDLSGGELVVSGEELVNGNFTIDMTTISEGNPRLEGHLRSDDFFGVDNFPEAALDIVSVTSASNGVYDVTANLTIKEITNEITFPVNASVDGTTLTGTASMTFNRSLWDVRYGSGSFFSDLGDDLINDEIEMEVEIVANS